MTYEIPHELAEAIAQYLANRPWREVHEYLDGLKRLKPSKEEPCPESSSPPSSSS